MTHPDLNKVKHLTSVQIGLRAYRAEYANAARSGGQHAATWAPVKTAADSLNTLVENILAGG